MSQVVYIHGFETALTAIGVEAFARHYLKEQITIVNPGEATTEERHVHARFLRAVQTGPGDSRHKILALSSEHQETYLGMAWQQKT